MQISRIRLSDKTSRRLSRATPSAVSERCSELIGRPISRSLAASCVCLELRSLPSPGVIRLQRHYERLRHPMRSGQSLAGVRLVIPDHPMGLPVLRALSLCTCCRHYPGAATGRRRRSSHPWPGGTCTHWRAPPCHGAHVKQTFRTLALDVAVGRIARLPESPWEDRSPRQSRHSIARAKR